ncbi:glycine cleavage system protein H [bacterium]|jgi:glycine cleavage system H protein|nr:glycine cleavage system protein H [Pirellulales bacterium]NBP81811.1 glycine cleavage system protein H [bacterium]
METVRFRHAHFSARFPVGYRYVSSHFWLLPSDWQEGVAADPVCAGRWRVGFTKFATRMLGELVEMNLAVQPGSRVSAGDHLGNVEGFKAVSDLFCVADGQFLGTNPALTAEACLTHSAPYSSGWLYEIEGLPQADTLDVHQYIALLEETIDRLQSSRYDDGHSDAAHSNS